MHRFSNSTQTDAAFPPPAVPGTLGHYASGRPVTGVQAGITGECWPLPVQKQLRAVATGFGATLDNGHVFALLEVAAVKARAGG